MDVATLAELLRETAQHHDHYEKTHPKHNWWDCYAPYLNARQNGSRLTRQPPPPIATWRRSFIFFPDDAVRLSSTAIAGETMTAANIVSPTLREPTPHEP